MINQQMGLPDVPTVKELWKDEKSKYRHWILLFGIGISVVFTLQLTSFILNMLSAESIKETLHDLVKVSTKEDVDKVVEHQFFTTFMIMPIIQLILIGLGLLYFMVTVYSSYKTKSFSKLSQWATMVIGIGAFIAVFQLFQMAWSSGARVVLSDGFPGGIFQFINYFLVIVVYFGASVKVTQIRRQFAISERVEQLKNDPAFQQQMQMYQQMMQNGGMQMGPMGPMTPPQQAAQPNGSKSGVNTPPVNGAPQPTPKPVISKEESDLNKMTIEELKSVAKELSISGTSIMKKDELIKAILRVTQK